MRFKSTLITFASAALTVFATLSMAQQTDSKDNTGRGPMPGMMKGEMMMNQMMAQHEEMSELMNKMTQSMKAFNDEKDPVKLRALLKEHADLMDQIHAKMTGEGKMMQNMMSQMKNCPMMDSALGKTGTNE